MKAKAAILCVLACLFVEVIPAPADSPIDWPTLSFIPAAIRSFDRPTEIAHAGDGSGRLFILERPGRIQIIQNSNVLAQPFLDISARTRSDDTKQGLLSLAFSPGFITNHAFYVNYNRSQDGAQVISRFLLSSNPNMADADSEQIIQIIPKSSHLAFGPDGYLYIGVGDNGTAILSLDTQTNAQSTTTLFGKLLRIDVESGVFPYSIPASNPFVGNTNYLPEIWALGLRNPRRFSFDRLTGDLYIGDSGFTKFEEIDFQPAGSGGGQNYGWKIMEGPITNNYVPGFTNFSALTLPVFSYDHHSYYNETTGSVIPGYVYRGPGNSRMDGIYFFADYYGDWFWGLKQVGTNWQTQALRFPSNSIPPLSISTFGEDDQGQLYLADPLGKIYRIQDTQQAWIPEFAYPGGILNSNTMSLSCLTPDAVIHYTTNGIDPTESDPIVPPDGIITLGYTNKARAFRPDLTPSLVATAVYGFTVGTPAFTSPGSLPSDNISFPPAPTVGITNNTSVTISTVTPGAIIYYTTNGTIPTTNSLVYSGPLTMSPGATLQAIGVASGYTHSSVAVMNYSAAEVVTPIFTPGPSQGPFDLPGSMAITNGTSISISCARTNAVIYYTPDGWTPVTNYTIYSTPNAVIYYTLDGSTPTTNSPVYSTPLLINGGTTVKAFAVADNYVNSALRSVFYSLVQTAAPVFNPSSRYITNGTSISISCATPGAIIYYTLDGSTPTTNSAVYAGPLTISGDTTVSAFATANEHLDSAVRSTLYPLQLAQTATPVFNPSSGPISNATSLSMSCATPGALIYYTLDGSTPTTNSPIYTGPLTINGGTTVRAFAVASGYLNSTVQGTLYQLVQTATPLFNPPAGAVPYGTSMAISCSTPGAIVYYTSDGTIPTTNSLVYTSPLTISNDVTIRAFAVANEHLNSATNTAFYTLTRTATPSFSPSQGPLTNNALITISCSASNAVIYYTTNGTVPDTNSAVYSAPILFSTPIALMARAYEPGFDPGDVNSVFYTMSDFENTMVTTFAGSSTAGAGYSNAVGTLARFSSPQGICMDKNGNLYVADTGNNLIRKISPSGLVSTFAGTGVPGALDGSITDAQFYEPVGVCIDNIGNFYITDGCNSIRKIATNGMVTTITNLDSFYNCALGQIAVDNGGNLYVGSASTVKKISLDGTITTLPHNGSWSSIIGVAVDTQTNVYVAPQYEVYRVMTNTFLEVFAGSSGNNYKATGYSDGPRSGSQFQNTQAITSDSAGNIFISDAGRIRKIRPDGWVSTMAGTGATGYLDGPGATAQFNNALSLCADGRGNIYVADTGNNCIRKISSTLVASPSLQITVMDNQAILSWPVSAENFTPETSSTLSANATWTPLTNGVTTSDNNFILTNNLGTSASFYRLHKP